MKDHLSATEIGDLFGCCMQTVKRRLLELRFLDERFEPTAKARAMKLCQVQWRNRTHGEYCWTWKYEPIVERLVASGWQLVTPPTTWQRFWAALTGWFSKSTKSKRRRNHPRPYVPDSKA